MPIVVDGVTMQACAGISADGVNQETVNTDGSNVYTEDCYTPPPIDPPGSVTIDYSSAGGDTQYLTNNGNGSWTFKVPIGKTSVVVCMVGGGGTGVSHSESTRYGGFAGGEISQSYAVTQDSNISLQVGLGGQTSDDIIQGTPGQDSTFGSLTAIGGTGATTTVGYIGEGAIGPSGCGGGGYYDGTSAPVNQYVGSGGQASSFGNGGNGGTDFEQPTDPGIGAGSGGVVSTTVEDRNGGNGRVKVTWS